MLTSHAGPASGASHAAHLSDGPVAPPLRRPTSPRSSSRSRPAASSALTVLATVYGQWRQRHDGAVTGDNIIIITGGGRSSGGGGSVFYLSPTYLCSRNSTTTYHDAETSETRTRASK